MKHVSIGRGSEVETEEQSSAEKLIEIVSERKRERGTRPSIRYVEWMAVVYRLETALCHKYITGAQVRPRNHIARGERERTALNYS